MCVVRTSLYIDANSFLAEYMADQERARMIRVAQMRQSGELKECECCMEDEVLPEEMIACSQEEGAHVFCQKCVTQNAKEAVASGERWPPSE